MTVRPGDFVLYRFTPRTPGAWMRTPPPGFLGETMWVLVADVDHASGTIHGRLASSPVVLPMQEDQPVVVELAKIEEHRQGSVLNRAFYSRVV